MLNLLTVQKRTQMLKCRIGPGLQQPVQNHHMYSQLLDRNLELVSTKAAAPCPGLN